MYFSALFISFNQYIETVLVYKFCDLFAFPRPSCSEHLVFICHFLNLKYNLKLKFKLSFLFPSLLVVFLLWL